MIFLKQFIEADQFVYFKNENRGVWRSFVFIIIFKLITSMPAKKNTGAHNKETTTDSFLLAQAMYDMTPPPPLPYPKMIHYSLEPSRHYHHRFSSSFLSSLKPLLIGCDVGVPVDQLILFTKDYNNTEGILDEEDEALIKESLMDVNQKIRQ